MLIKCPECQRDISDTAPSCPGCGFVLRPTVPIAQSKNKTLISLPAFRKSKAAKGGANGCLIGIGVAAVLFVFVVILSQFAPSQPDAGGKSATSAASDSGSASAVETPEHKANFGAIPVDMARIYNLLRDQSGVKWGTVTGTRNGTTLCGSVNAHNGFGGYTGQRRFIFDQAVGDPGLTAGRDAYLHWEEHPGFAREWRRLCRGDPNSATLDGQLLAGQVEALAPLERESGR